MILDFLHKFSTEKYIIPKYNDDEGTSYSKGCSKGYWYFDFKKDLLMYNWDNGNITVPKGPYATRMGTSARMKWSEDDKKLYNKFWLDWLENAHKTPA